MRIIILFLPLMLLACQSPKSPAKNSSKESEIAETETPGQTVNPEPIKAKINRDTLLTLSFRNSFMSEVQVRLPKGNIRGNILMLHGWNLPASQWCDSTGFCTEALNRGYALIIPELSLCNYPLEIYPETMKKYRIYPDLPWITDSLIPLIGTETGLLQKGQANCVAGISTGGRGATLLAYYLPELFTACASLSGDFDITDMQDEFLYQAWFGSYEEFPERWQRECFAYDTKEFYVPCYIAHGQEDKVSPCAQSVAMADSLKKKQPDLRIKTHFPEKEGHNYRFWRSETQAVLDFFGEFPGK